MGFINRFAFFNILFIFVFNLSFSQITFDKEKGLIMHGKYGEIQKRILSNSLKGNYDSVIFLSKKYLQPSENKDIETIGLFNEAKAHYFKNEITISKNQLLILLKTLEEYSPFLLKQNYDNKRQQSWLTLFYIERHNGNYIGALNYIQLMQRYYPESKHVNVLLFTSKIDFGEYEEALEIVKTKILTNKGVHHSPKEVSSMYNNMADIYLKMYEKSPKTALLDSSNYYYKYAYNRLKDKEIAVEYDELLLIMRQAKIAFLKKQYKKALQYYKQKENFKIISERPFTEQIFDLGIGDCYYKLEKPDSAVIYLNQFLKSYYNTPSSKENLITAYNLLSKSYDNLNQNKKAYEFAKLCLEESEKLNLTKQKGLEFVHFQDINKIKSDSQQIILEQRNQNHLLVILGIVLFMLLLGSIFYYQKRKKQMHQKYLNLIEKLNANQNIVIETKFEELERKEDRPILDGEMIKKIGLGLKKLEEKQEYLKPQFKSAFVAKKLNTNTAYLSQYFTQIKKQSFNDYIRELRINYVLNRLRAEPTFRNYTLQAIAEEIGYKDASTFVRVFKKQTGISPLFFIKELNFEN